MGVGILLAVFGPLLLIVPMALVYWLLARSNVAARFGWRQGMARVAYTAIAALSVLCVVGATYLPGKLKFNSLCENLAEPRVIERARADGFFLDDSTADSFGMRYLHDEGFAWFEARDISKRDGYARYRKEGGKIVRESVSELKALYTVQSTFDEREQGILVSRTAVTERASGKLLAEAHSVTYHGGPLGLLLGVHGLNTCPWPVTQQGSRQFDTYYHLARDTLLGTK
ncbi:MAG: hypothetical protein A2151_01330 [Candidatus Muproteobacteria bacterium RBG_16_65_34]|uniref:Uncharacterized protein n=1 Tax=Candidatus Muproteobacteria bacterium RBG_16_65_34 TaxID=1817760 RepID=A0A1F6TRP8_9PROT|nr:MAG: hypothetical protein A2151_01330 [Candidatus Muproteobacteria bacterium RBG_16_65_34]